MPCLSDGPGAPSTEEAARDVQRVVASRTVITPKEEVLVQVLCLSVWIFIFIFGIVEAMHGMRQGCSAGDPRPGAGEQLDWLTVSEEEEACEVCSFKNGLDCERCTQGWFNFGTQCFKYLENLPPMMTGAALGGSTYFALIIAIQFFGLVSEICLIRRVTSRKLMPRKELFVLGTALFIEVSRMFLVDIFVMQEYFGGRAYHVFRQPNVCSGMNEYDLGPWRGADSESYCDDLTPHDDNTRYYFAAHREAWSSDEATCSTFTTASSMLNFDEVGEANVPGHTRFKTMGWAIGGEFALYYTFATFINELADNMFVVPTTTSSGWFCKIFSVALEVFQLGALCPAAVFTHRDCLHFTAPLGVSLHAMSGIVIVFGYLIWSFVFMSLPLAVAGALLLTGLFILGSASASLAWPLRRLAAVQHPRLSRLADASGRLAIRLDRMQVWLNKALEDTQAMLGRGKDGFKNVTMTLAFVPMLCGGIFLGTLVVVGQASKQGALQVLTAIVLLSDVLFKVFATAATELGDYALHRRVRSRVRLGGEQQRPAAAAVTAGEVVGRPVEMWATPTDAKGSSGNADDSDDDACCKPKGSSGSP